MFFPQGLDLHVEVSAHSDPANQFQQGIGEEPAPDPQDEPRERVLRGEKAERDRSDGSQAGPVKDGQGDPTTGKGRAYGISAIRQGLKPLDLPCCLRRGRVEIVFRI